MKRKKSAKKNWRIKTALVFVLPAVGIVAASTWLLKDNSEVGAVAESTQNNAVVYPTQYSDTHITENAVATDPQFKDLAIVDTAEAEQNLANVLNSKKSGNKSSVSEPAEAGTWLWTPILQITPAYQSSIIAGAKKNGVKNIYVSIDSYLDIFVMKNSPEKTKQKKLFSDTLENLVTAAHNAGMTVDAEGGWRNWAEEDNTYKAFAVVDFAMEFNKTHAEKLRGFQYDVEPYLLDSYRKNKAEVLKNFVSLINGTVTLMQGSDLQLSIVIPEFYDNSGETPSFAYAGRTSDTVTHLLDILEQKANSKLIVMSYRNYTIGEDGSIAISTDEIDDANNYNTKVVIAQETGAVTPSYVTFHNTSRKYYDTQVATIEKTFAHDKSFGGIATHYINAYLALK